MRRSNAVEPHAVKVWCLETKWIRGKSATKLRMNMDDWRVRPPKRCTVDPEIELVADLQSRYGIISRMGIYRLEHAYDQLTLFRYIPISETEMGIPSFFSDVSEWIRPLRR